MKTKVAPHRSLKLAKSAGDPTVKPPVKEKSAYICFFTFQGKIAVVESEEGLHIFNQGFWLDEDGSLHKDKGIRKFWIPPHVVHYVEKRNSTNESKTA